MKKQTLWLLLLLPTLLAAQPETNLLNDKNFFVEKSLEYDKWLKASGLGKVLRVETVRVTEQALSLDLGFYTTHGDSVVVLWSALKRDFEKQDRGVTLEEELFYKMVYFMEIKPTQGYVQLFNSYDTKKDLYVCFRRSIKYDNGHVIVDSDNCKTQIQEFMVETANLANLRTVSKGDFSRQTSKEAVFQRIKNYIQTRYTQQPCEFRKPKVEWNDTQEELWFTVTDLCKEVLTDETNPWWCSVLEPACSSCKNCTKREMLDMHIRYTPTATGYQIRVTTDAKFGSGWYSEVKRGAYKNMELDYKSHVEKYALRFKNDLFNELKK